MPNRAFEFKVKKLTDAGEFTGYASVYDIVDLGNDCVDPGAFTKTLAASGPERPLLWQHSSPIGLCSLQDTPGALLVTGKLSMALQIAKDAYALLKDGVVRGLSIGFQTVKESYVGEIRHLQELKLWEVSLVTFPMNEAATITGVKSAQQQAAISRALQTFRSEVLNALEGKTR